MKKYKTFFIKTLVIFLSAMIIIPFALITWVDHMIGRHNYSKTADYINYLIKQKQQIAEKYDKLGNKIVICSGSNTLYSINSKYIHEKTGLPVVNFGIHAGLENYIFYETEKILKSGDIVFLPLEYDLYKKDSPTVPSQLAEYLVTYGQDYFPKFSIIQKLGLSFYLVKLIITYHKLDADPVDEEILSQTNDYGDYIGNIGTKANLPEKSTYKYIIEEIPQDNKSFALYDFINYCKNNNIKLYAMLPFICHKPEYSESEIKAYNNIKAFYAKNGIELIGDMKSGSVYDKNLIYDYGYHANQQGQKQRSDYMISVLNNYLDK